MTENIEVSIKISNYLIFLKYRRHFGGIRKKKKSSKISVKTIKCKTRPVLTKFSGVGGGGGTKNKFRTMHFSSIVYYNTKKM